MSAPDDWEFRLSPDRRQFAVWEPGNEPWFAPEANMQGRWITSADMDRLGWTRFAHAEKPETDEPSRTKWPSAQHLQPAADQLHEPDPNLDPEREFYTAPLGDWLDKVANELAWLAPYREHEGGYRPWRAATRAAHGVLGLPDADTCTVCHPPRRGSAER